MVTILGRLVLLKLFHGRIFFMEKLRSDKRKAKKQKRLMIAAVIVVAIVASIVIGINLSGDPASVLEPSKEAAKKDVKTRSKPPANDQGSGKERQSQGMQ